MMYAKLVSNFLNSKNSWLVCKKTLPHERSSVAHVIICRFTVTPSIFLTKLSLSVLLFVHILMCFLLEFPEVFWRSLGQLAQTLHSCQSSSEGLRSGDWNSCRRTDSTACSPDIFGTMFRVIENLEIQKGHGVLKSLAGSVIQFTFAFFAIWQIPLSRAAYRCALKSLLINML